MNLTDFSRKRAELGERRKEMEARLAELALSTEEGATEKMRKLHGELAVLHMQISALERVGSLYGSAAGAINDLPSIDELMLGANDLVAGMFNDGKGFFQSLKSRLNEVLGADEIAAEKKHHFDAVISLLKAGKKKAAYDQLKELETDAGLSPTTQENLEHTINAVESLVLAGQENAARAVLARLYA